MLSTFPLSVGVSPRAFSILETGRVLVANSPTAPSLATLNVSDTGACANFTALTVFSAILFHSASDHNALNHLFMAISAPRFDAQPATLAASPACVATFVAPAANFSAPAAFATRLVHFALSLVKFAPPSTIVRRSDATPTGSYFIASSRHFWVPYLCINIACHSGVAASLYSHIAVSTGFDIPLAIPE